MASLRIAVTGAGGQLGRELVRVFRDAVDEVLEFARPDSDITDPAALRRLVQWRPDVVINSAAWTDVDGCARDSQRAMQINGEAAGAVAEAADRAGARVVQISTNEVFDGQLDRPYREDDQPNPINPYGASKLAGERLVAHANRDHVIIRTAWLFGPGGTNFVTKIIAAAARARAAGEPLQVVDDEWGNPTPVAEVAEQISVVARRTPPVPHILHLAGEPPCTRLAWAQHLLGDDPVVVQPVSQRAYPRASMPPQRALLSTEFAQSLGFCSIDWRRVPDPRARSVGYRG